MTQELLALLEEGPQATADLAQWLQQPRIAVVHHLGAMRREGLVKRIGTEKRWALIGYEPRVGRPPRRAAPQPRPPERVAPAVVRPSAPEVPDVELVEMALEEVPDDELPDLDVDETPDHQVLDRLASVRRPLRQPVERPSVATVRSDAEPSFWVNCDRAELNRRIAERQEEMRNSKAARWIDGTVRDR